MSEHALLSIILPVYRGAKILDDTFAQLIAFEHELPENAAIEIIAVDDGSDDDSYEKIIAAQKRYPGKISAVKLSRNYGAIAADQAGLEIARGDCVAVMPQDLQEPPELFLRMFKGWQEGIKINLGVRTSREDPIAVRMMANAYYFLFRRLAIPEYPKGGLCVFLVDRQITEELKRNPEFTEPATRLYAMGYSRRLYEYHRRPVTIAKSNWTLTKKIEHAINNLIAFSYLPVRLMSIFGLLTAFASFIFAAYVLVGKFGGWPLTNQPPGWATIVVLLTFLLGLVMTMLGVIGEYLWRILEAARNRPTYLIEEVRRASDNNNAP